MNETCSNCGKPTAETYEERHDPGFCSAITSPSCWRQVEGDIHLSQSLYGAYACGAAGGNASSNLSDVTCEACIAAS